MENAPPSPQPPAAAWSSPSPHPTDDSAALLSHLTPPHTLAEGSSSPTQALSWLLTARRMKPLFWLELHAFRELDLLASTSNAHCGSSCWNFPRLSRLFLSLCLCSSCLGCQECLPSPCCQTPTLPSKPSSDVTAISCIAAPVGFPGLWFIALSQHPRTCPLHGQSLPRALRTPREGSVASHSSPSPAPVRKPVNGPA